MAWIIRQQIEVMIDDVCKIITDVVVLYWVIYKWQKVVSTEFGEEKEAQCVTVVELVDCHFFCFPKWKRETTHIQREREKKEKGKEMEEIRLVLRTMSLYVSVYVTCLKQSRQSQTMSRRETRHRQVWTVISSKLLLVFLLLLFFSLEKKIPIEQVCMYARFLALNNEYDRSFTKTREANETCPCY
jgi:hypothetical protein